MEKKKCTLCKKSKKLTSFAKRRQSRDGRTSHCKLCRRKHYPPRLYAKPEHRHWSRYRLDIEVIDQQRKKQMNTCAICQEEGRRLCVDQETKTLRLRGLLCHSCLKVVKTLTDDLMLKRTMQYLRAARTKATV